MIRPNRFRRALAVAAVVLAALVSAAPGSTAGAASGDSPASATAKAIFAGGCFWCVESDFDHVPGVIGTVSGFTGGPVANPTYKQVTYEDTGHREAVEITYDPTKVSYEVLLDVFWHSVDPTDAGGQFCDRGFSYTTAIYATTADQLAAAKASKAALEASGAAGAPIVTEIVEATPFWPAEDYHQGYYDKNPVQYKFYRWNCGRDARLDDLWGKDAHRGIVKE